MRPRNVLGIGLATFLLSLPAAAVPREFGLQGVLRDGQGRLQSMPVDVTVALFDAQKSGQLLAGPYGPTTTTAENGLFSLDIADDKLGTKVASATEVWMEVTVGTSVFPRQRVGAEIFAMVARRAESAAEADQLSSACVACVDDARIAAVAGSKVTGKVAAALVADTAMNGVVTSGSYSDPAWITSLDGARITGTLTTAQVPGANVTGKVAAAANADTVTNGLYSTGSYADPAWLQSLAGGKIAGPVGSATTAVDFTGSLLGDVTGTQAATVVTALRGRPLATQAPSDRQTLKYDAVAGQWSPALDDDSGGTITRINTGVGLTGGPITTSGTLALADTAVAPGSYGSASTNARFTVDAQGRLVAASVSPIAIDANQVISGTLAPTVGGTGITSGPSSPNQFLRANSAGNSWTVGAIAAADLPGLSATYVDLASDQTIGGAKTFTSPVAASITGNAATATTATRFTSNLAGDVTGPQGTTSVGALRGRPLSAQPPTDQQVLKYDATAGEWLPAPDRDAGGTVTRVIAGAGLSGGTITDSGTLAIAPGGVTNAMLQSPSLTLVAGNGLSGGGAVALGGSVTLSVGTVGTANGGTGITSGPSSPNQFLRATTAGNGWTVGTLLATDLPSLSGAYVDLVGTQTIDGAKTFTRPINGDLAGNAATVTNGVYTTGAYADPGFIVSLSGAKITGPVTSATTAVNFTGGLGGDVTGSQSASSVVALRGKPISGASPADQQVLRYDGAAGLWAPASISGGTVTSVGSGAGLVGGPITGSGSLALDLGFSPTWTGNHTFSGSLTFTTLLTQGANTSIASLAAPVERLYARTTYTGAVGGVTDIAGNGVDLDVSAGGGGPGKPGGNLHLYAGMDGSGVGGGYVKFRLPGNSGNMAFFDPQGTLYFSSEGAGQAALDIGAWAASPGATKEIRFRSLDGNHYVGFKAPDVLTANPIFTLPNADGTAGQVLTTDGAGRLGWANPSGGGGGGVTRVDAGAGLTGGPITGSGTLAISLGGVTKGMLADQYVDLSSSQNIGGNKSFTASLYAQGGFGPGVAAVEFSSTGSMLGADQGGHIELGGSNTRANGFGSRPYIDFHYGTGGAQDYNVRLQNDANGRLSVQAGGGGGASLMVFGTVVGDGGLIANNNSQVNGTLSATLFSGNGGGLFNVNADQLGGLSPGKYQRAITSMCAAGTYLVGVAQDGTVTCAPTPAPASGYLFNLPNPAPGGYAVAHLTFNAPTSGYARVTATYTAIVNNFDGTGNVACEVENQISSMEEVPTSSKPGVVQIYLPETINSLSSAGRSVQMPGSISVVLPVVAGPNTFYFNGAGDCPDFFWAALTMEADFFPWNLAATLTGN